MKTKLDAQQTIIVGEIAVSKKHSSIIAVAGAGKTTCLVAITERLLNLDPRLLFLSSMKRPCHQFRLKLSSEGVYGKDLQIRTFHSLAFKILNDNGGAVIDSFNSQHFHDGKYQIPKGPLAVLDNLSVRSWIYKISQKLNFGFNITEIEKLWKMYSERFFVADNPADFYLGSRIRWDNENGKSTKGDIEKQKAYERKITRQLLQAFEKQRLEGGCYCYQDTLVLASALVRQPDVALLWSARYPIICVDEFQNLNRYQLAIMTGLAQVNSRLIVAGDPRQSINRHMGAEEECFKHLQILFPKSLIQYELNGSHRLTEPLAIAVREIEKKMGHSDLKPIIGLNTHDPAKLPKLIEYVASSTMIADLCDRIQNDINSGIKPNEILVSYRFSKSNATLKKLREELKKLEISFIQLPMSVKKKSILKKFISLLVAASDVTSMEKLTETFHLITRISRKNAARYSQIISKHGSLPCGHGKSHKQLQNLWETIKKSNQQNSLQTRSQVLLKEGKVRCGRSNNYRVISPAFANTIFQWLQRYDDLQDALEDYEEDFEYHILNSAKDSIILSTIHSAQGASFKSVFLLDASHTVLSRFANTSRESTHDLLCLLYVGLSRSSYKFTALYSMGKQQSKMLRPLIKNKKIKFIKNRIHRNSNADWIGLLPKE